jgi:AcrR family transcriptional regulator
MKGNTFQELREREQHLRRQVIIIATEDLFSRKAFHEISMKDIAESASVSVASIYRYFDSQDDLLLAVLLKDIDNVNRLIKDLTKAAASSLEEIACIFVDYLLDNEATFQIACHFLIRGNHNRAVSRKFESVKAVFLDRFDSGLNTMDYEKHTRIFSESFFASILGIVITYRDNTGRSIGNRDYLHELAKFTARAFNYAMKTSDGH